MRTRAALCLAVTMAAGLLTGCGLSLNRFPSSGGVSGPTYSLIAVFSDAHNLTVGGRVKLDGVVVGQVSSLRTKDYTARIALQIKDDVKIPDGATAEIRFTTPLGEDFIQITSPPRATKKFLSPGAEIGPDRTSVAPSIEDAFSALSMLLNGGGLEDLAVIAAELNKALGGREPAVRETLGLLNSVMTALDAHKKDFTRSLDALHALTKVVDSGSATVDAALTKFPVTLQLLSDDTDRLVALTQKVGALATSTTALLDKASAPLIGMMAELQPVLRGLSEATDQFVPTMKSLQDMGRLLQAAAPGDYLGAAATGSLLLGTDPFLPRMTSPSGSSSESTISLLGGGQR